MDTKISSLTIIARPDHNISRNQINDNALKVLYRLKNAGFQAFLVGGGVRDLLLGRQPKDFDISTDATPEDVKHLFKNCRLIGRRFRLAHVHFGGDIIEVATFRGQHDGDQGDDGQIVNGMIVRDNVYGTLEEDAWRRDFSVNSLYYNIQDFSVVDYVGGMEDLKAGQLRMIGEPEVRYREDPVRMLRAVRFAAKLDFKIEAESEAPLATLGQLLEGVPPARLFEELLKLFLTGDGEKTFNLLHQYQMIKWLFPQTEEILELDKSGTFLLFLQKALANTDARIRDNKPVTPAFLMAVFLWGPINRLKNLYLERGMSENQSMVAAADAVVHGQNQRISIPRRFHSPIRDVWFLQDRFPKRAPKRSLRVLAHPRFRAAYDFLVLRAEAGEVPQELADWWTEYQKADDSSKSELVHTAKQIDPEAPARRRKPRRRRPA